jgi:hypothetical protein
MNGQMLFFNNELDEMVKEMLKNRAGHRKMNVQFIFGGGDALMAGYPHSHIGKYSMDLENVTEQELEIAVKFLCANGLATKVDEIHDYYGNAHNIEAPVKLKFKGLNRGMAVKIENGKPTIVSDIYGFENDVEKFKTLMSDTIKAVRTRQGLAKQRYKTSMKYSQKTKEILLVGVQY